MGQLEEEKQLPAQNGLDAALPLSTTSSSSRRYVFRPSSAASGRLSRVDHVLHRLKRQRERRESREWLHEAGPLEGDEEEGTETDAGGVPHPAAEAAGQAAGECELESDGGEEDEVEAAVSPAPRKRARSHRTRGSSHRGSAAEEYDDGSGFVVYSDEETYGEEEEEGEEGREDSGSEEAARDETIAHMWLHNQLQAGSDDELDEGGRSTHGTAHTASSPLAAVFSASRSHLAPVQSLDVAFRYWLHYLASVLLDEAASAAILSDARWIVEKAVKVVEEQFESRINNWVQSSTWQQRGRERFYTAVTQLPYITSRRLNAYDAISDSTEQGEVEPVLGSGSRTCDTCHGQHQATHYVEIFGVPYDHQQLRHPFDKERIFRCCQADSPLQPHSAPLAAVLRCLTLSAAVPRSALYCVSAASFRRLAVQSGGVPRRRAVPSPYSPLSRHAPLQVSRRSNHTPAVHRYD